MYIYIFLFVRLFFHLGSALAYVYPYWHVSPLSLSRCGTFFGVSLPILLPCPILEEGGGPYIVFVIHPACKFGTMPMHSVSFSHPCVSPVNYFGDTGLSHVHPADGRGWIGYDPYRYCRMELRLPLDKPQRLQAMVSMHLMGYMPSCTRSESLLGRLLLLSGQEGFLHHTMFFLVVGTTIPPIWTLLPMQI